VFTEQQLFRAPPSAAIDTRHAMAPSPRALSANITAGEAEAIVAAAGGTLLVAHDGVATVRSINTPAAWMTADPTQAVFIPGGHPVAIEGGSCSGHGFSALTVTGNQLDETHDGGAWSADVERSGPNADHAGSLAAIPWSPRRMLRLFWLERRIDDAVADDQPAHILSSARTELWPAAARHEASALLAEAFIAGGLSRMSLRRLRARRAAPTHRELTEAAKRFVARDPAQPHSLSEVARALCTSPYHLAHVFRVHAGVPFHRFLLDLRIAISLTHLNTRGVHLSSLGLHLGFATHSHFSAVFRRAVGFPPSRIRMMLDTPSRARAASIRDRAGRPPLRLTAPGDGRVPSFPR
jgi:AraC-like DNA-binding protein